MVIIHYSLLAYAIYTQQIHGATAIKSGCVIACKVIMTVETATKWVLCETINLVCLMMLFQHPSPNIPLSTSLSQCPSPNIPLPKIVSDALRIHDLLVTTYCSCSCFNEFKHFATFSPHMWVMQTKLTIEEPTASQQECANHERKAEREERETAYIHV